MTPARRRHGQPLAALGLIVGGWIAVRVVLSNGGILPQGFAGPIGAITEAEAEAIAVPPQRRISLPPVRGFSASPSVQSAHVSASGAVGKSVARNNGPVLAAIVVAATPGLASSVESEHAASFPLAPQAPAYAPAKRQKRWSADSWLLLRRDGKSGGGLLSTYGASQAGAVLRYRLMPASGHRPTAYVRAAAALDGSRQREAAAGLSARPLPAVPVVTAAEVRVTSDRFGTRTRPAVFAYTEMPPFDVAPGLRGEAYLQGGYVGGKAATAFVDGQVRVDRRLAQVGRGEVRFGGGVWGGAQEGASRLDFGPAAQLAFPLSREVFARVAFDWRFRIAGKAAPSSGPTLTLSAGF